MLSRGRRWWRGTKENKKGS